MLDKFEKKLLIDKVIPLLLKTLTRDTQLAVHVLPIVISQLQAQSVTPTQFRDKVWPSIMGLCSQRELPAQALYLLLKN